MRWRMVRQIDHEEAELMYGRLIEPYLVSDVADNTIVVELSNWNGKA